MGNKEEIAAIFLCCWSCSFITIILACGSFAIDRFLYFNAYQATGVEQLASVYDMGRDWQRKTFTDIEVRDKNEGCRYGWEPIYNRIFYGIEIACDCLGRYGRYLDTENEFVQGKACDTNQTRYGCGQVNPFPAVYMHVLDEKMPCGLASGPTFL